MNSNGNYYDIMIRDHDGCIPTYTTNLLKKLAGTLLVTFCYKVEWQNDLKNMSKPIR